MKIRQQWHKGDERFSQWQWSCLSTNPSPRCLVGKCPDILPVHVSLSNPSNAVKKIWEIFLCGKNTNFPLSFVPFYWGSLSTITFTWTLQFPFLTFKKNLACRLSRACDELKGPSAFLCLKGFHSLSKYKLWTDFLLIIKGWHGRWQLSIPHIYTVTEKKPARILKLYIETAEIGQQNLVFHGQRLRIGISPGAYKEVGSLNYQQKGKSDVIHENFPKNGRQSTLQLVCLWLKAF